MLTSLNKKRDRKQPPSPIIGEIVVRKSRSSPSRKSTNGNESAAAAAARPRQSSGTKSATTAKPKKGKTKFRDDVLILSPDGLNQKYENIKKQYEDRRFQSFYNKVKEEAVDDVENLENCFDLEEEVREETPFGATGWLILGIFFITSAVTPILMKKFAWDEDESSKMNSMFGHGLYKFPVMSVFLVSAVFGIVFTTIISGSPIAVFQKLTSKQFMYLFMVRLIFDVQICLDMWALTMVSIADKFVYGNVGLFMLGAMRAIAFADPLNMTQSLVILLILLLILARNGDEFQRWDFSKEIDWLYGIGLLIVSKFLGSLQRVTYEKILKKDLKDLTLWEKLSAGSCLDIPIFTILLLIGQFTFSVFKHDGDIFMQFSGNIFGNWDWYTIALPICTSVIVITLYTVLEMSKFDAVYLSCSTYVSALCAILAELYFMEYKESVFEVKKFMIILAILGCSFAYELESLNQKYFAKALNKMGEKNQKQRILLNLVHQFGKVLNTKDTHQSVAEKLQNLNLDEFHKDAETVDKVYAQTVAYTEFQF